MGHPGKIKFTLPYLTRNIRTNSISHIFTQDPCSDLLYERNKVSKRVKARYAFTGLLTMYLMSTETKGYLGS